MPKPRFKNISVWPQTHAKILRVVKARRFASLTNAVDVMVDGELTKLKREAQIAAANAREVSGLSTAAAEASGARSAD